MQIELTPAQWEELKDLVHVARRAEAKLGSTVEVANSATSVEVEADKTTITLSD